MAVGDVTPILPSGLGGNNGRRFLITDTDVSSASAVHASSSEASEDPASLIPYKYVDYITLNFQSSHNATVTVEIDWGNGSSGPPNLLIDVPPGNLPPISLETAYMTGGIELKFGATVANVVSVGHRIERHQVAA